MFNYVENVNFTVFKGHFRLELLPDALLKD